MKHAHKSCQGPASCCFHWTPNPTPHHHISHHLTLPSPLLISSASASAAGEGSATWRHAVRCVRWGPSISLIKQELIKVLACAHAGGRIKPHHAQPPWQGKKNLSTQVKRLSQEWNLIQGELLKWGALRIMLCTWQDLWVWHVRELCCMLSSLAHELQHSVLDLILAHCRDFRMCCHEARWENNRLNTLWCILFQSMYFFTSCSSYICCFS